MSFNENWAEWVRRYRTELGLTQKEVAQALGVDASYASLMEKGAVPARALTERLGEIFEHADPSGAQHLKERTLLKAGYSNDFIKTVFETYIKEEAQNAENRFIA